MKCFGAIEVRFQCPFNGLKLSGDSFYAFEKIVFVRCDMTHWIPLHRCFAHYRYTPYTYTRSDRLRDHLRPVAGKRDFQEGGRNLE
ncbi:hypothetical protein D3C76_1668460 [compost metagenome]